MNSMIQCGHSQRPGTPKGDMQDAHAKGTSAAFLSTLKAKTENPGSGSVSKPTGNPQVTHR